MKTKGINAIEEETKEILSRKIMSQLNIQMDNNASLSVRNKVAEGLFFSIHWALYIPYQRLLTTIYRELAT